MTNIRIQSTNSIVNHFFWVLLTQGVLAIFIAIIVLAYPPFIIPLVSAMFLWQGLTALFLAVRVRRFRKEAPELFA